MHTQNSHIPLAFRNYCKWGTYPYPIPNPPPHKTPVYCCPDTSDCCTSSDECTSSSDDCVKIINCNKKCCKRTRCNKKCCNKKRKYCDSKSKCCDNKSKCCDSKSNYYDSKSRCCESKSRCCESIHRCRENNCYETSCCENDCKTIIYNITPDCDIPQIIGTQYAPQNPVTCIPTSQLASVQTQPHTRNYVQTRAPRNTLQSIPAANPQLYQTMSIPGLENINSIPSNALVQYRLPQMNIINSTPYTYTRRAC